MSPVVVPPQPPTPPYGLGLNTTMRVIVTIALWAGKLLLWWTSNALLTSLSSGTGASVGTSLVGVNRLLLEVAERAQSQLSLPATSR